LFHRCYCGSALGEPRLTLDVDLTILTGFGDERSFIDSLLGQFPGRISEAWLDVEGIIIRQGGKLDEGLIFEELRPLADLKQEREMLDRLKKLLEPRGS